MTEKCRRVLVCGPSCSGKTTTARRIAERIGQPCVEMDAIFWKPGWVESPWDEFREKISAELEKHPDGWVFDGNYSRTRDLLLPQADTFVWLRPNFITAFWRLLKRTVARCVDRKPVCGDNTETWRQAFFSGDSLILYQLTHWKRYDRKIINDLAAIPHNANIVELRTNKEIDDFIARI